MSRNFVVYDSTGSILRTGTCEDADVNLQAQPGEYVLEATANCEKDCVDVSTKSVLVGAKPAAAVAAVKAETYAEIRQRMYPSIGEQLDMLWHAMDANTSIRSEPFYSILKSVKDTVPKTNDHVFDVGSM